MQRRRCTEYVVQEDGRFAGPNSILALGRDKAVGNFQREYVGSEEFVKAVPLLITQTDRLGGAGFRDPGKALGRVHGVAPLPPV
jgi:hypothetical protein